jgi:hypothetical protein
MATRNRIRNRLTRLEQAAAQPGELIAAPASPFEDAPAVARELARNFREMVQHYQRAYGLSPEEAVARTAEPLPPNLAEQALSGPCDDLTWNDLESVARGDPDAFLRRWEQIKQQARGDIGSGHYACRVVDSFGAGCWARAVFLALRDGLVEAWRPRNGQELQLIDQMAQAQTYMWRYQESLMAQTCLAASGQKRALEGKERYEPPRLSTAAATEEAMAMIERWHAIYLKTLKALQGLRRGAPTVVVRKAAQVNVAENQLNFSRP